MKGYTNLNNAPSLDHGGSCGCPDCDLRFYRILSLIERPIYHHLKQLLFAGRQFGKDTNLLEPVGCHWQKVSRSLKHADTITWKKLAEI